MVRPYAALLAGVVSVSFAATFIRLAEAPPLVIAAYRLCIASLVLLPTAWIRSGKEMRRARRRTLMMAVLSGVFLAVHFALWITSLKYTSVATSVVLVTASPIFIAIASRFLFGQRLRPRAIAGIAVSLVGAVVIGYGNWAAGAGSLAGAAMAFAAAIAVTGYLLIGQALRQHLGTLNYASVAYGTAAALLLSAALALRYPLSGFSGTTYAMLILLAFVPQLIGHTSLNWALRFIPATLVAVAVLGEPVGATLWAFLILKEAPAPTEITGGLLILAGILVAMRGAPSTATKREEARV